MPARETSWSATESRCFLKIALRERVKGLRNPVEALLEILHGEGIGEPDAAILSEGTARHNRYMSLFHKIVGKFQRRRDQSAVSLPAIVAAEVGEDVEGTRRSGAAHTRDLAQPL